MYKPLLTAGLIATPFWAGYKQPLQQKEQAANVNRWSCAMPTLGTIGLATLVGGYNNNWLKGALIGTGLSIPGMIYARLLMQREQDQVQKRKRNFWSNFNIVKSSIDRLLETPNLQKDDFLAAYVEIDKLASLQKGISDNNAQVEVEQLRELLENHETTLRTEPKAQAKKRQEDVAAMLKLLDALSRDIQAAKTLQEANNVLKKIDEGIAQVNKFTILTQQKDDFKRTLMNLVHSKVQELTPLPTRRSRTKSSMLKASLPLSKEAEKEQED